MSFNRTIIELKYMKLESYNDELASFNRTIIELKFIIFCKYIAMSLF